MKDALYKACSRMPEPWRVALARAAALMYDRVTCYSPGKVFLLISEHYRNGLLADDFRFGKA
ncbi:MAG: hypothetical protein LBJ70_04835, partial [Holosporales bacterium]|nr:hypothetical protein [Holosporales bacterium]